MKRLLIYLGLLATLLAMPYHAKADTWAYYLYGEINADVALHSLSASKLGFQYIFKTEKALNKLIPIEKYYLCAPERDECKKQLIEGKY